jgi:hypothetical protein
VPELAAPVSRDASNQEQQIADDVQRRQAARRNRQVARPAKGSTSRSRWWYVPLPALFEDADNPLYPRSDGSVETGHQPCHGSKSGRCVVIDPAKGIWWCRSCQQGGTAVTLLQQVRGWTRRQAICHLIQHYGPPPKTGEAKRPQPRPQPRKVLEA